jgi:ABC-2 type transport system ATP-binding protein
VVPDVLSRILANHAVVDVSVEDPPIEEIIAEMFLQVDEHNISRKGAESQ